MFSFFSFGKKKQFSEEEIRVMRYVKSLTGKAPNKPFYYLKALTHRSWSEMHQVPYNNERLEFLGDAVLDSIVSDYLFQKFPDKKEAPLLKYGREL
ncbi:hypothetical protein KFE98_08465 [bacterium SCSIO 12741]|nr:hypothetical protein KFE98_08465 [bacterium SCSIO 12741]